MFLKKGFKMVIFIAFCVWMYGVFSSYIPRKGVLCDMFTFNVLTESLQLKQKIFLFKDKCNVAFLLMWCCIINRKPYS